MLAVRQVDLIKNREPDSGLNLKRDGIAHVTIGCIITNHDLISGIQRDAVFAEASALAIRLVSTSLLL